MSDLGQCCSHYQTTPSGLQCLPFCQTGVQILGHLPSADSQDLGLSLSVYALKAQFHMWHGSCNDSISG